MYVRSIIATMLFAAGISGAATLSNSIQSNVETVQPLVQSYAEYLRTHKALLDPMKPAYERGVVLIKVRPVVAPVAEGAVTFGVQHLDNLLSIYGAYKIAHAFGPVPRRNDAAPAGVADELSQIYAVNYLATQDPIEVSERLALDPSVEFAEPSPIRYLCYTPNDYLDPQGSQYQIDRMHVDQAWGFPAARDNTTTVVPIAIVDSGVDLKHEELTGLKWWNPSVGRDGYSLDSNGVDLVGSVTDAEAQNGKFIPDGDPSPGSEHGTHVAGDADAMCDNGVGMCGTAFNCPIMAIKCGTDNPNAQAVYRGYEGIRFAADHGAGVINCSWGGPGISQTEQVAIDYAVHQKQSVVVVAAGNSTNNNDINAFGPASLNNVLSVGATGLSNSKDVIASFSDFGISVRTWAPGTNVYSSLPRSGTVSKYGNLSGTSMASPCVAGVVALLRKIHSDYSAEQIAEQIHVHSRLPLNNPNRRLYYGMLDAYEAIDNDSLPGIVVASTQASANNDTVPLQITLKNLLHAAGNLRATLTLLQPNQNLTIATFGSVSYGPILSNSSATRAFNVRLAPGVSRVVTKFVLTLVDGNTYVDYLIFTATISRSGVVAWNLNTNADSLLYSVHAINDNIAWAAGGGTQTQVGVVYNTLDGTFWNQVISPNGSGPESKQTFYCIDALLGADQTQRVWLGTSTKGTHRASVYYSTYSDAAGFSWNPIDVSGITKFVNSIHFFNSVQGVIMGDPVNGTWGLGLTTDGGHSWNPIASPITAGNDTGWNNASDWVGGTGWFCTSASRIFKTVDSGHTWNPFATPFASPQGIAFSNASTGIAFFNPPGGGGGATMARSFDGGGTWAPITGPGVNPRYTGIVYVKGSSTLWLCGYSNPGTASINDFVYVSNDNGTTWTSQTFPSPPSPALSYAPTHISMGSGVKGPNNQANLSGWIVGSAIIDYNQQFTVGVQEPSTGVITQHILQCYPNPFSGLTLLKVETARGLRPASLIVYNALGAVVANLSSEVRRSSGDLATALFDAAGMTEGMYYAVARMTNGLIISTPLSVVHP